MDINLLLNIIAMIQISVVVPCHNMGIYLSQALDSILSQSYKPSEIIVIDDASSDCTKDIVKRYSDCVLYVKNALRKGVSFSRNLGVKLSSSPWIAFLDADDFWHPKKLEKQVDLIATDDNVLFVHTGSRYFFDDLNQYGPILDRSSVQGNNTLWALYHGVSLNSSTVLLAKDIFCDMGGFNEDLIYSEDYDLWLRLASRVDFNYVNEVLAYYRIHATQTTMNLRAKYFGHLSVFVKNKTLFLDKLEIDEREFWLAYAYRCASLAYDAFLKKNFFLTLILLSMAAKYNIGAVLFGLQLIFESSLYRILGRVK